ncbi:MAG: L-threonylcarbamoyladenylate synthase [Deltaproteobacteria bacterium]|nr:L-threonylcarbamoyladenylate synthase [Deltaproteobacteria bacterium]
MKKRQNHLHDKNNIIAVDSTNPETDIIKRAGKIIQNSGVVIFPAQYLYGVAVNALNEKSILKVFHLKKRPINNPLLLLIHDQEQLSGLVKSIPASAQLLMDAFWPGNLTIVFKAKNSISRLLTANTAKIGIRIPAHPVAKALVKYLKSPITGTSANLSGQKGCSQINQLGPSIIDNADLVLDAGILKGGTGTTIIDVTTSAKINIIRQGEISALRINEILDKY